MSGLTLEEWLEAVAGHLKIDVEDVDVDVYERHFDAGLSPLDAVGVEEGLEINLDDDSHDW